MLLDSTLDTRLAGKLSQNGGAMTLSSSKISLGTPDSAVGGLALSQSDLSALTVDDLTLRSRGGIDIYGSLAGTISKSRARHAADRRARHRQAMPRSSIAGNVTSPTRPASRILPRPRAWATWAWHG